jgi:hypothetical protein
MIGKFSSQVTHLVQDAALYLVGEELAKLRD